jgi:hypothetical protein
MSDSFYFKQDKGFAADHVLFWTNLSRMNGLLVLLNISMFFLTGLVAHGYYYTCYSLAGLGAVGLGMIVPTVLVRRLWYYLCFLFLEGIGIYFFVASFAYWIRQGAIQGS